MSNEVLNIEVELKKDLLKMSENISQHEHELYDLNFELKKLNLSMDKIELLTYSDITNRKTDGKPTYSNEKLREIAVKEILEKNFTYNEFKEQSENLNKKISDCIIELEFLKRNLKINMLFLNRKEN